MQCLSPPLTAEEVSNWGEDEDWMCPFCTARGELLHYIHEYYWIDAGASAGDDAYEDDSTGPGSSPRSPRNRNMKVRGLLRNGQNSARMERIVRAHAHLNMMPRCLLAFRFIIIHIFNKVAPAPSAAMD